MASLFPVSSLRIEKECGHMTERMLNLTLEIIYLLTGENYIAFKLCDGLIAPNVRKIQNPFAVQPPSLTPERKHEKKIEEVTQKMIELLTGEVSVGYRDTFEEHKEVYKDVMTASQLALKSPDGSSNRNPPERCPHPLYSRDSTQEHPKIPQEDQENNNLLIKVEDKKDQYVGDDEPYIENLIKVKVKQEAEDPYVMNDESCKEEDVPPEINTDGQYRQYSSEKRFRISPNSEDDDDYPADSPEDPITTDLYPSPHSADLLDRSTHEGGLTEPYLPDAYGEKFPCSEYSKCFPLVTTLLSHNQTRTTEGTLSCPDCGKKFTLKKDLVEHLASHGTDQPYSCSFCKKRFLRKSRLDRHEIIHTGHKPYSCSMCSKRFTQKANLARHERTHTGEKPFACPECGKCFTRKATLIEHRVQMHRGLDIGQ